MKILITGAGGFIGSNLITKLSEEHVVYGLVRKNKKFKQEQNLEVIEVDLACKDFISKLPSCIDTVIHLAQSSRYKEFPEGVDDMISMNIYSTGLLLDWARRSGVNHFIFSSTANVYAINDDFLTEQSQTIPDSFYGASKLAAEHLALQYKEFFQVDVLRCFTVYGPFQTGMLIPNIIDRIKHEKKITLANGKGIFLSPVFLEDAINVISKLINGPFTPRARLMNLCGDEVVSLLEIVEILEKQIGKSALLEILEGKVLHFTGSNSCLKSTIGSYEFLDLRTGLDRVVSASCRSPEHG